jgi:hypothetical protein
VASNRIGTNHMCSTARSYSNGSAVSIHAEIDALNKYLKYSTVHGINILSKKHKRVHLLVIRINNDGELRESAPCYNCSSYIHQICIKKNIMLDKVIYSKSGGLFVTNFKQYKLTNMRKSSGWSFRWPSAVDS